MQAQSILDFYLIASISYYCMLSLSRIDAAVGLVVTEIYILNRGCPKNFVTRLLIRDFLFVDFQQIW